MRLITGPVVHAAVRSYPRSQWSRSPVPVVPLPGPSGPSGPPETLLTYMGVVVSNHLQGLQTLSNLFITTYNMVISDLTNYISLVIGYNLGILLPFFCNCLDKR